MYCSMISLYQIYRKKIENSLDVEGSTVGGGHDDGHEENGEAVHHDFGADAVWRCVAVVCGAPGERLLVGKS